VFVTTAAIKVLTGRRDVTNERDLLTPAAARGHPLFQRVY